MNLTETVAEIEGPLEKTSADDDSCRAASVRILVVDDEPMIRELLADYLQEKGFACEAAGSGEEGLKRLKKEEYSLLVTDMSMPGISGLELLSYVANHCPGMAVIVITAIYELGTAIDSMKLGAYDYITKPFDLEKALKTVREALKRRDEQVKSREIANEVKMALRARTDDLQSTLKNLETHREGTLEALVRALDAREHETGCHSGRVRAYSVCLAERLGLKGRELEDVARGALLHDIGKIGISDSILLKPGKLTEKEWVQIRKHPLIGYDIVKGIEFLRRPALLIKWHHERFDGTGYPSGLKGAEIPLVARIFAVIDTFDALTSDRSYRKASTPEAARQEIKRCSGTQFDPEIVKAFLKIPQAELDELAADFR